MDMDTNLIMKGVNKHINSLNMILSVEYIINSKASCQRAKIWLRRAKVEEMGCYSFFDSDSDSGNLESHWDMSERVAIEHMDAVGQMRKLCNETCEALYKNVQSGPSYGLRWVYCMNQAYGHMVEACGWLQFEYERCKDIKDAVK